MLTFSQRYGYKSSVLQYENASETLKKRVFASFYKQEFDCVLIDWANSTTEIEEMMIEMGVLYEYPQNDFARKRNIDALQKYIMSAKEWYIIFDFIEKYLMHLSRDIAKKMSQQFNRILEEEASAYRIIDNLVVPLISEQEIESIETSLAIPYDSVRMHLRKAVENFANRKNPDYENSIKDSISAVEAMCCIITENKDATLGKAINALENKGIRLHGAFKSAISSLYGYTSKEGGIRHGSIDFTDATVEDTKYMLITCSAFVNYLIAKWEKVK